MSTQRSPGPTPAADGEWRRLSVRVIWVDLVQSVVSLLPAVVAIAVFQVEVSFGALWPLIAVAAWGVIGAIVDAVRWLFTSYRVSESDIERRTGVFVRRRRSVRRDRIRSVDTSAKLRHRLAGLRVVAIGAGQQTSAGEAAFLLDALTRTDAERLRRELIREGAAAQGAAVQGAAVQGAAVQRAAVQLTAAERDLADSGRGDESGPAAAASVPPRGSQARGSADTEVFATLRPWWVVYNLFSIWAYLMAAGLLWGAFWLASSFGMNLLDVATSLADWDELGPLGTIVIALVFAGFVGAVGMGVNFLVSYWRFELARVRSSDGSFLRTRRGLLSTREVNRDEARMRGLTISEPLLWRWMGMADTNVITTGLGIWDLNEPTAILPRGPKSVAREVGARVLGVPSPLEVDLPRHPRAALRRRLWWATATAGVVVALVALPVATGAAPVWVLWAALGVWPVCLAAAVVAYRALGHAIVGDYLIVRGGLMSRATSALRRDAVSTIAVRQSILQRRLGLSTVAAMTAAGWSAYEARDVAAPDAVSFAARAAPGLIDEFVDPERASAAA